MRVRFDAQQLARLDLTPESVGLGDATDLARQLGLHVHMGHGLNYWNVQAVCRIPGVEELNIGHSIVAQAVFDGLPQAVRAMKQLMLAART